MRRWATAAAEPAGNKQGRASPTVSEGWRGGAARARRGAGRLQLLVLPRRPRPTRARGTQAATAGPPGFCRPPTCPLRSTPSSLLRKRGTPALSAAFWSRKLYKTELFLGEGRAGLSRVLQGLGQGPSRVVPEGGRAGFCGSGYRAFLSRKLCRTDLLLFLHSSGAGRQGFGVWGLGRGQLAVFGCTALGSKGRVWRFGGSPPPPCPLRRRPAPGRCSAPSSTRSASSYETWPCGTASDLRSPSHLPTRQTNPCGSLLKLPSGTAPTPSAARPPNPLRLHS